jgi:ABC-type multidrug transport system fused ATPase/permease subunit
MLDKVSKFKKFLGPETTKYLFISIISGFFWFLAESSFVFMIQGFLLTIGILAKNQVFLPSWYPIEKLPSVALLIFFGLLRGAATIFKGQVAALTQGSFLSHQRKKILTIGLKNGRIVSSKEVVALFSEIVSQGGSVLSNLSTGVNVVCALVLFFISGLELAPREMIFSVILLFIFLFPLKYATSRVSGYGKILTKEWENINESFLRGLKNTFFLFVYNQVDPEIEKGHASIENFNNHYLKYSLVYGFATAVPSFIGIIILSLITFASLEFFKTDPVKLISFFYLFIRFAQAAGEGSASFTQLKVNMPGLKKLYRWEIQYSKIDQDLDRKAVSIEDKDVEIVIENLGFGYANTSKLFQNLNFKLSKSDILVIKGESGAGKSTLLNLVLGLNLPSEGCVKINNYASNSFKVDLSKVLGYVGPEPFLIQGTIRENLFYGLDKNHQLAESELWNVLRLVGLEDLISNLPLKLDEPLNDIAQISTGQRQRLSFARALARKPSLLILDEATANLDVVTERQIITNITGLLKNCTCVIVTHKNSFDDIATKKIVLGT